jgi:excisionase family DNA binding protein
MPTLEPLALSPRDAAAYLSISKRTLSRLIAAKKIEARKDGPRTLVDVASLKAYYTNLPKKTDHAPIVFGRRAHVVARSLTRPLRQWIGPMSDRV